MTDGLDLFLLPEERIAKNRKERVQNLRFFLTFIGAVAYLQSELWDEFAPLHYLSEVKPGVHTTLCKRKWTVGGIDVEDEVKFPMNRQLYFSGIVGHENDFSTLVVWGIYDDPRPDLKNPKVGAFWTTEMKIIEAPKDYHLGNSRPRIPGYEVNPFWKKQ